MLFGKISTNLPLHKIYSNI